MFNPQLLLAEKLRACYELNKDFVLLNQINDSKKKPVFPCEKESVLS